MGKGDNLVSSSKAKDATIEQGVHAFMASFKKFVRVRESKGW